MSIVALVIAPTLKKLAVDNGTTQKKVTEKNITITTKNILKD